MIIYLTRHGETYWNRENRLQGRMDSPLTEKGIKMAKSLRETSKDIKFDKVYSSMQKRAYDTAKYIVPNKEIIKLSQLNEIDIGKWSSKTVDDVIKNDNIRYKSYFNDPANFKSDGGESLVDLSNRVKDFFEKYILNSKDSTILIVSHGVTITAILNYIEKNSIENFWNNRVRRNGEYNIIEYKDGEFKIIKKAPRNPVDTI